MSLKKEFEYYKSHQNDLIKSFNGKYIVIIGEKVAGTFETEAEAYKDSMQKYEAGTFLIQKVSSGEQDYTATFNSRVIYY